MCRGLVSKASVAHLGAARNEHAVELDVNGAT
jgi:hypothetical protein